MTSDILIFRSPSPGVRGDPFGPACLASLLIDDDRAAVKGVNRCFYGRVQNLQIMSSKDSQLLPDHMLCVS